MSTPENLLSERAREVLPQHVAIIMDGNGRWANQRRLPRTVGHRRGMEALRSVLRMASQLGIRYLTVYAFSAENWSRPADEVDTIMTYLVRFLRTEIPELNQNNIQLDAIGQLDRLPPKAQKQLQVSMETLSTNTGLTLVLALSYGGRQELAQSCRSIAHKVAQGHLLPDEITEETIAQHLDTEGMPDPDLVIRTSGEMRVSNFLLWQISYAEWVLTDVLWPDFRGEHLVEAIETYASRHRRFGKV